MFEVGQCVWDVLHGEGTVASIGKNYTYPVIVKFTNNEECSYTSDGKKYAENLIPALYAYPVEIVKAVTKPSIDWSHVNTHYKWLAMDADGKFHLYTDKPLQGNQQWTTNLPCTPAINFASFVPGTCDWKDSLVKRPN